MVYSVNEIFYSIQGEGANVGTPALFVRFAGCNLDCAFCDTEHDFTTLKFTSARNLVDNVRSYTNVGCKFVILTGGEPALQVDQTLIDEFHRQGFKIAIETNGTINLPRGIDWVCVSPKTNSKLVVTCGDEIKVVFPTEIDPNTTPLGFRHKFIQPLNGDFDSAIKFCLDNPRWRLSIQSHKLIGIK
jgi:7-carboxy-7-deazaguanine synthase